MAKVLALPAPSIAEAEFEAYLADRSLERRDAIVVKHAGLVKRMAAHFARDFSLRDDLEQVGYVGLIKAVERYEPQRGVPFVAYARTMIGGEMSHYLRDLAPTLRPPRWFRKLNAQLHEHEDHFTGQNGRPPTEEELAAALNIRPQGVRELRRLQNQQHLVSLSAPEQPNWQAGAGAIRSQRHVTFQLPIEDRIVVENALERLAAFERQVVYLFFYMDLTQTEIAARLGSTQRQISRMLARTIKKLKADVS